MSTAVRKEKKGLGIERRPIVEQCVGCERVIEDHGVNVCAKYADPSFHWENGQVCLMATHKKREVVIVKRVINPLKASKRMTGGKKKK